MLKKTVVALTVEAVLEQRSQDYHLRQEALKWNQKPTLTSKLKGFIKNVFN